VSLHIGDSVTILNANQLPCQWLTLYAKGSVATITAKYKRDGQWFYNTQEFGSHYKGEDLKYHSDSKYVEESSKSVAELFGRAGIIHDWKSTAYQLRAI